MGESSGGEILRTIGFLKMGRGFERVQPTRWSAGPTPPESCPAHLAGRCRAAGPSAAVTTASQLGGEG